MSDCTAAKITPNSAVASPRASATTPHHQSCAVQQVERDAQQAVDRGLQHDAAHQRGHRRRRGGMRLGQPDVQRQQARLGAEAEQREEERGARPRAGQSHRAHRRERVVAAAALQHAEAEQDRDGADVRDQQVQEAGAADLRNPVFGGDEEERRQRHRLPRDHEHVRVVGDQHQRHRREERVVLEADEAGRRAFARAEIAGGVQRDRGSGRAQQQQEERRQRIEAQVEGQVGQPERQDRRLRRRGERQHGDDGERQPDGGARGKQHAA